MNNKLGYQYAGVPRSPGATRSLIINLYSGKSLGIPKDQINEEIEDHHQALSGLAVPQRGRQTYVSQALGKLPNANFQAFVGGRSYWKINHLELGTGNNCVYCFYCSREQNMAIRDKKWYWKCNIGRTANNPFDRIREQTGNAAEDPIIPLLIRTDDETALERHIHDILKERGRHLTNTNSNEDFLTCPSEVARIFFDSPYFSGERISL